MEYTLDVSWKTIIKIFFAGFVLYILFLARDIVIWFFFALIISLLIEPAIDFLRWFKVPKILAVILVYLAILFSVGLITYLTTPIFIFEIKRLAQSIPDYFNQINPILRTLGIDVAQNFEEFSQMLIDALGNNSGNVIKIVSAFFGGVSSTMAIFALAFFISLEEKGSEKVLALFIPSKYEDYIISLFERAKLKVSGWFMARILACLFVGISSFVVFFLLGVKYSFILALLSGILNFVPYIGPSITLVFSVLFVGISSDWILAIYTLVALLAIQEIENKFLSPVLMKKFIDLPPVLVLMSLFVGGVIFGFWGTIFSVPVAGIIYELLKEFLRKRKEDFNTV